MSPGRPPNVMSDTNLSLPAAPDHDPFCGLGRLPSLSLSPTTDRLNPLIRRRGNSIVAGSWDGYDDIADVPVDWVLEFPNLAEEAVGESALVKAGRWLTGASWITGSNHDQIEVQRATRLHFEKLLADSGLLVRRQPSADRSKMFVLISMPFYQLCWTAEHIKLCLPITSQPPEPDVTPIQQWSWQRFWHKQTQPETSSEVSWGFSTKADQIERFQGFEGIINGPKSYATDEQLKTRKTLLCRQEAGKALPSRAVAAFQARFGTIPIGTRENIFRTSTRQLLFYRLVKRVNILSDFGPGRNFGDLVTATFSDADEAKNGTEFITSLGHYQGLDFLVKQGIYTQSFGPHEINPQTPEHENPVPGSRSELLKVWRSSVFVFQPLNKIRNYCGEQIALHYMWIGHLNANLILFSVLGAIVLAIVLVINTSTNLPKLTTAATWEDNLQAVIDGDATIVFAFILCIGAVRFLETWKQHQVRQALQWNVTEFEESEITRPQYRLLDPSKQQVRFVGARSFMLLAIILVLVSYVSVIVYRVLIQNQHPDDGAMLALTPPVINTLLINIWSLAWPRVAVYLNDYENHRTNTAYEDALVTKLFLLNFVNHFTCLFYIAFFQDGTMLFSNQGLRDTCVASKNINGSNEHRGCFPKLAVQIITYLVVTPCVKMVIENQEWWRTRLKRKLLQICGGGGCTHRVSPMLDITSGSTAQPLSIKLVLEGKADLGQSLARLELEFEAAHKASGVPFAWGPVQSALLVSVPSYVLECVFDPPWVSTKDCIVLVNGLKHWRVADITAIATKAQYHGAVAVIVLFSPIQHSSSRVPPRPNAFEAASGGELRIPVFRVVTAEAMAITTALGDIVAGAASPLIRGSIGARITVAWPEQESKLSVAMTSVKVKSDRVITAYSDKVIQYSLVVLFAAAMPLAPILVLITNSIDMRLDIKRMIFHEQRMHARRAEDIGRWQAIIAGINYCAALTNACLIAFSSTFGDEFDDKHGTRARFIALVVFQNAVMLLGFVWRQMVPDTPRDVATAIVNRSELAIESLSPTKAKLKRRGFEAGAEDGRVPAVSEV